MLSGIITAGILAIICRGAQAQTLQTCPTSPYLVTSNDGVQFSVCPNTDYQVPSYNIINSVASASICTQLCANTNGCQKAVYDHMHTTCHLKGNPTQPSWVTSSQFDTIRYVQTIADRSPVTSCANKETVINNSDGSQSIICPMSDYEVGSNDIINSVSDAATCASLCVKQTGCKKAVYDHIHSICHLKGDPQYVSWVVSLKQYDSIRIVVPGGTTTTQKSTTVTTQSTEGVTTTLKTSISTTLRTTTSSTRTTTNPSPSTSTGGSVPSCLTKVWYFKTDDGSLYQFCPQTDYSGPSSQVLPNVLSDWDCMQICNQNPGCTKVVYDNTNFVCHIKGSGIVWTSNSQFTAVTFVNKTTKASTPYSGLGSWSPVIVMPVIPVAAYVVPQQPTSNRILMFSSWGSNDFSGATGITQFADYNYQTGAISQRTITNTQHDMFCPGISALQDGRIIITGGQNAEVTSFYNPTSDSFSRGPDMKIARGYQSSATTSNGGVFTIGGSFSGGIGGKTGEIFDPVTNTWTVLPGADVTPILTTDAEGAWRTDNHAWLFGWKNQSVFQAGPSKQQHWYDTNGNGRVVAAAVRDPNNDAMCGVNVMYDAVAGKIFSTGGSQSYTNSPAFSRSYITTIGDPYKGSQVQAVANMHSPRGFANGVVLPDGTILVTGGQKTSIVFTNIDSSFSPELYDPVKNTFTVLAPAAVPRNYHSVALLLPDGTVFTGGGGMCPTAPGLSDAWCYRDAGYRAADHPNVEIFSPPYLFNPDGSFATRPVISSLSSSTSSTGASVKVGGTLTVQMQTAAAGTKFSLIRMGSATHSINTDQRRVPLANVVAKQAQYTITLPNDSGILLPGYYYLFAISSAGVPCVARTVQVTL